MWGLPPQLTWHPLNLTAQQTTAKAEVNAADAILTSSKLHQWYLRMSEIWTKRKTSSRWKNLWKPCEKPTKTPKNVSRCNLRPQTVTFFSRPTKSWSDCDSGDIRCTGSDASYGPYGPYGPYGSMGWCFMFLKKWRTVWCIISKYQNMWNWIWICRHIGIYIYLYLCIYANIYIYM